jgi:hypothetical protein
VVGRSHEAIPLAGAARAESRRGSSPRHPRWEGRTEKTKIIESIAPLPGTGDDSSRQFG